MRVRAGDGHTALRTRERRVSEPGCALDHAVHGRCGRHEPRWRLCARRRVHGRRMAVKFVETTPAKDARREEDGPSVLGIGWALNRGSIEDTTPGDIET